MTQKARPNADLLNNGWLPVPVYAQINEAEPDTSTFVTASPCFAEFAVRLSRLAPPAVGPDEVASVLKLRLSGPASILVELLQGDALIAGEVFNPPSTEFSDHTLTLTRREAAKIKYLPGPNGDPDLRVRVRAFGGSGGSGSGSNCQPCPAAHCIGSCPQCEITSSLWLLTLPDQSTALLCHRPDSPGGNACVWYSTDNVYELYHDSGDDAWVLVNHNTDAVWWVPENAWACGSSNTLAPCEGSGFATVVPLHLCAWPEFDPCSCDPCPGGVPESWAFSVSGCTGDFEGTNGDWVLRWSTECTWAGALGEWGATIVIDAESFTVTLTDGLHTIIWSAEHDCCDPAHPQLVTSIGTGEVPSGLTVDPSGPCEPCPPKRYACVDGSCVAAAEGAYATLEECQAACGGTVETTCCPGVLLPETLYAHFSGSLAVWGTVEMTWDGSAQWTAPLPFGCGTGFPIAFVCKAMNGEFLLGSPGIDTIFDISATPSSCSPFSWAGSGTAIGPCSGSFSAIVDTIP